jgi:acetate---CoA ligase (ADP-forming)
MPSPGLAGGADPAPLDSSAVYTILTEAGFQLVRQAVATTAAAAALEAGTIGYPVALKASVPGLMHKAHVGGVRLNIDSPDAFLQAAAEMRHLIAGLNGFIVQPMGPSGLETVVGFRRDPGFGPVVMVGLGGELVEAIGDVAMRLAPVTSRQAGEMIAELRISSSAALATRFRAQLARLAAVITQVSEFAMAHPEIVEMDLNPIILTPDSAVIVDAKLVRGAAAGGIESAAPVPESVLKKMLHPTSIAVVGASANRRKQGGRLFHYLVKHGFAGSLYPVNPREIEIMGHKCYASVEALPTVPDLACIVVSVDNVEGVVEACGKKGIGAAAIYTSGYGETGAEGGFREEALIEVARRYGMRICGPNTAGLMNVQSHVCAAIGMAFEAEAIPGGKVGMISQSGAIGSALLSRAWDQEIAVGQWICTGNEADLTLGDYMLALAGDPECRALAIFMETVRDPRSFERACAEARRLGKPVVVYKCGRSPAGRRAMQTHTGAIAGDDQVYDAVFKAYGVIRVPDLQSLLDCSAALSTLPLPRGSRVGVVSASGGACSVIADECARRGLPLAQLSSETTSAIARVIPTFGVSTNPVDVTMDVTVRPTMISEVATTVLQDPGVDALLVMLTTNADPPAIEVAKGLIAAVAVATKPVLICRLGADFLAPESVTMYRAAKIPLYPVPERAVVVLRALADAAGMAAGQSRRVEVADELPA